MKVTLEFQLPDEAPDFHMHIQATAMHSALWEIQQALRSFNKHTERTEKDKDSLIEKIMTLAHEVELCG